MAASFFKDADRAVSTNDRAFVTEGLAFGCRLDGRGLHDFRSVKFEFALDDSSATLMLGSTRVLATLTAELEPPFPDRPSEGIVRFNVECGPMASPAFEAGRPSTDAVQLARLVERTLKQSGALDCEALCVVAGRKVWSLRCDIHVLDHGGNLVDACVLAALAVLMVYRKPEVTVGGGESGTNVVVHPREIREPLPLTIHHTPISVTWALFRCQQSPEPQQGRSSTSSATAVCAVDPSLREQAAQAGSATFMVNTSREVCGVHKVEGLGLRTDELHGLVQLSFRAAEALVSELKQALKAHEVARVAARVRHTARNPFMMAADQGSRHVCDSGAPTGAAPQQAQTPLGTAGVDGNGGSSSADESSEPIPGSQGDEEMHASRGPEEEEEQLQPAAQGGGGARLAPLVRAAPAAHGASSNKQQQAATVSGKTRKSKSALSSPAAAAMRQRGLDDNLETIAALVAGAPSPKVPANLGATVKQHNLASAKKAKKK